MASTGTKKVSDEDQRKDDHRRENRRDDEQRRQQELNQGFSTGTEDVRHVSDWGSTRPSHKGDSKKHDPEKSDKTG